MIITPDPKPTLWLADRVVLEVTKISSHAADKRDPRVYWWPQGETIIDNLVNRRDRPNEDYRRLMPSVLMLAGYTGDIRIHWSQHAGCTMCPCSPGFILRGCPGRDDLHVSYRLTELGVEQAAAMRTEEKSADAR